MPTQANEPRSQRDDVHGIEDTESCQIVRIPEDYDILKHATDNLAKDIDKEQDQVDKHNRHEKSQLQSLKSNSRNKNLNMRQRNGLTL